MLLQLRSSKDLEEGQLRQASQQAVVVPHPLPVTVVIGPKKNMKSSRNQTNTSLKPLKVRRSREKENSLTEAQVVHQLTYGVGGESGTNYRHISHYYQKRRSRFTLDKLLK